ncbi:23211_t:CDS:2, partial [Gigaspora rosea]
HWSAMCNYCNEFWYKGSPAVLEDHLGNSCNKAPLDVRNLFLEQLTARALDASTSKKRKLNVQSQLYYFVESTKLTQDRIKDINRALVKAFIVCRIPFHIIENPFFVELLKTLCPAYEPPSKDVLFGRYLAQKTAFSSKSVK